MKYNYPNTIQMKIINRAKIRTPNQIQKSKFEVQNNFNVLLIVIFARFESKICTIIRTRFVNNTICK